MNTALITGGSSGIGYGLSEKFASEGYRILWVSKPKEELAIAKKQIMADYPDLEIHTLTKDLSKEGSCKEVHEWANNIAPIDVLINNAGFGTYGFIKDCSIEKEVSMIQVNVKALYLLTRYFMGDMMKKDTGTIINISSNSSFETVPRMLTYSSTKAFVKHFSRGLNEELKMINSKVKVITICPAAVVDTNFKKEAKMERVKTFEGLAATSLKEVVADTWSAFEKGKSFQISGWKMRWLYKIYGFIPFSIKMKLTADETSEI
tara:strand:- start:166 stop:951 length:786 start_codon:yes stop_codon:yes gene_type:complete